MVRIISSEKLLQALHKDTSEGDLKRVAQLLLDAINDWPTASLSEPLDFLGELTQEIGAPLDSEQIQNYARTLSVSDDAWKLESLSSLFEIFACSNKKLLNEIVADISQHYE